MDKSKSVILIAVVCFLMAWLLASCREVMIEPIPYGDGKKILIIPSGTNIGSMKTKREGLWMDIESWQRIVEKLWEAEKMKQREGLEVL